MLTDEQHRIIAITDSVVLLSTPKEGCLYIPLGGIEKAPIKLCKMSFQLGWAAAKNADKSEDEVA